MAAPTSRDSGEPDRRDAGASGPAAEEGVSGSDQGGDSADRENGGGREMALPAGGGSLARRWLAPLRALARRARSAFNRTLHPLRRRMARSTLEEIGIPSRILLVCHGNICRSPYAEAALRRELPPSLRKQVEVRSAGFIGPDRPSPPPAVQAAEERSVDLSSHRSRLLDPEVVRSSGLIFVMDTSQRSAIRGRYRSARPLVLGDLDPGSPGRRRIRDPVGQPVETFRTVYDRIDRCVEEVARLLPSS